MVGGGVALWRRQGSASQQQQQRLNTEAQREGHPARGRRVSLDFLRRLSSSPTAAAAATTDGAPTARRISLSMMARPRTRSDAPLYMYRAPGLQARVGLRREQYASGESVEGAVILYRDADSVSMPRVIAENVRVQLHCEVARRKTNHSFRSDQQFRAQNVRRLHGYTYARSLVPSSHPWSRGPWEARYHSAAESFAPPVEATVDSAHDAARATLHRFELRVPLMAPQSRVWVEAKRHAFLDIRYRIVATALLSSGDVLMAECVFLVSGPPTSAPSPLDVPLNSPTSCVPLLASSMTHRRTSGRSLVVRLDRSRWPVDQPNTVNVAMLGDRSQVSIVVQVVERATYAGRLRCERVVAGAPSDGASDRGDTAHALTSAWTLRVGTLCADVSLGALVVTHEVRVRAMRAEGEVGSWSGAVLLMGATRGSYDAMGKTRAATKLLRSQPPIAYYWHDELPLFANLQYTAAAAGASAAPCAQAVAARLPRLTQAHIHGGAATTASDEEDVCMFCLSSLADDVVTRFAPCGHVLHLACAADWLRHVAAERRPSVACPMCKRTLQ